jgi:predicted transposase YdaD
MEKKEVKHIADVEAKKEVKAHEKKMHKGYAKGGKTNDQMRKLGRNLAKVANQKVSSFKYKSSRGG